MGGVAGHLSHLYDNRDLTFNKMAEILQKAASGELVGTEKTDGYNIYLGYVDGKPRAARNKGDMSRGGMTFEDLINREFRGGEDSKRAYVTAFNAYSKALESLSDAEKAKIFGPNGEIFYNTEIQGPVAPNVVNYDENVLNIHRMGHKKYNKEKNSLEVVSNEKQSAFLDSVVDRFEEATADESFNVRRTAFLTLNKITDEAFIQEVLDRIQRTGYSGDMTINDYLSDKLIPYTAESLPELDDQRVELLVRRMLGDKSAPTTTQITKGMDKEAKAKVSAFNKNSKFLIGKLIKPIEMAIHDFAVELLRGLKSAYILDNEAEVERLKNETEQAIRAIQTYEGPEKEAAQDILVRQLKKLKHHDNIDTVVEGFVFQHDGQMYKFTGNFAPMNQLLGLFRYGRGKIPQMVKEAILEQKSGETVAIYPGRFQPMGRHHAAVYNKILEDPRFDDVYIATSGKIDMSDKGGVPKSPFSFEEKQMIAGGHGIDTSKIIQVKNPYNAVEITEKLDPDTVVVYFVGCKDMDGDPRTCEKPRFPREALGGFTKSGSPRYFRAFDEEDDYMGVKDHAYIAVAPHVDINIPGYGEMSGTTIRQALSSAEPEEFETIMGFYDPVTYDIVKDKLSQVENELKEANDPFLGIFRGLVDEVLEELTKKQIKARDKRAKKIMKSTKKQYGKEEGEDIAYAIATNQVKEEELEELSASGASAVAGPAGSVGTIERRKPSENEVNEALNYLLQKLGV